MDRILFGDNQFFGINHMSEDQAQTMAQKFQSNEAVLHLIDGVLESGIKVFMCTTHDRVAQLCESFRNNPSRYEDLQIYPCMPYAHKYANAMSEKGMMNAIRQFLPSETPLVALLKNGVALAVQDVDALVRALIDAEMKMFVGLKTPVIFLQNVVTDLIIGLGFHQALRTFHDYVQEKYGAEPGFITMNLPILLTVLDDVGIENPIVCANINKIGFRMSGGVAAYEDVLSRHRFRAIAMSVFASGAVPPREAVQYVCGLRNIESILFGASSLRNVKNTKELVDEFTLDPTDRVDGLAHG
jgi:hypothetical protein